MGVQETGEELSASQAANPASSSSDAAEGEGVEDGSGFTAGETQAVGFQEHGSSKECDAFVSIQERTVHNQTKSICCRQVY